METIEILEQLFPFSFEVLIAHHDNTLCSLHDSATTCQLCWLMVEHMRVEKFPTHPDFRYEIFVEYSSPLGFTVCEALSLEESRYLLSLLLSLNHLSFCSNKGKRIHNFRDDSHSHQSNTLPRSDISPVLRYVKIPPGEYSNSSKDARESHDPTVKRRSC
jgi:hypothetical protein